MHPQLISLESGFDLLLSKPIVLVGRHPECDIQLNSRKVSRKHCCIACLDDYLIVRDLESTNGILINGVRVNEGKVFNEDELTIGDFHYRVRFVSTTSALPSSADPSRPASKSLPMMPMNPQTSSLLDQELESAESPISLEDRGIRVPRSEPSPIHQDPGFTTQKNEPSGFYIPDNLTINPPSSVNSSIKRS